MSRFFDGPQRNILSTPNNYVQEQADVAPGFQENFAFNYCMAPNNKPVPVETEAVISVSSIIIPFEMKKRVIGRGGEILKSICYRSGADCEIDRRTPVFCNTFSFLIHGNSHQIEHAKSLIRNIAGEVNPKTGEMEAGVVHEDAPHQKWKMENRLCQPYPLDDLRYDQCTGLPDFRKQWIDYYAHVGDFDSANALNVEVMADERKLNIQGYEPDRVDWDWQDLVAWQTVTKKKIKLFCEKNATMSETFQDMSSSVQNFPQVNGYYTNLKVNDPLCKKITNSSDHAISSLLKAATDEKIKTQFNNGNEGKTLIKVETKNPLVHKHIEKSLTKKIMQENSDSDNNCESEPQFDHQSNSNWETQRLVAPDENNSSGSTECDKPSKECLSTKVINREKRLLQHKHKLAAYYRDSGNVAESEAIESSIAQTKVMAVTARVQARKRAGKKSYTQVNSNDENNYDGDRKEKMLSDIVTIPYKKFCRHSSNEEEESESDDFDQDSNLRSSGAIFYDDPDDASKSVSS